MGSGRASAATPRPGRWRRLRPGGWSASPRASRSSRRSMRRPTASNEPRHGSRAASNPRPTGGACACHGGACPMPSDVVVEHGTSDDDSRAHRAVLWLHDLGTTAPRRRGHTTHQPSQGRQFDDAMRWHLVQSEEYRVMRRRRWLYGLLGITGGLALLGAGLTRLHPPPLIFNLSASVPRGLYGVRRVSTL